MSRTATVEIEVEVVPQLGSRRGKMGQYTSVQPHLVDLTDPECFFTVVALLAFLAVRSEVAFTRAARPANGSHCAMRVVSDLDLESSRGIINKVQYSLLIHIVKVLVLWWRTPRCWILMSIIQPGGDPALHQSQTRVTATATYAKTTTTSTLLHNALEASTYIETVSAKTGWSDDPYEGEVPRWDFQSCCCTLVVED